MNELFDHTKLAAYYLWEYTGSENALNLWYCAEDIACFLDQSNVLESGLADGILKQGVYSEMYIWFVRHIAFRLYIYTNNPDDKHNWYTAEHLLNDAAWVENITMMANILREGRGGMALGIRSDEVRAYYVK
jgi:hypothetical protein